MSHQRLSNPKTACKGGAHAAMMLGLLRAGRWSHSSFSARVASRTQPQRSTDLGFLSPGSYIIHSHVRGLSPILC